MSNCQSVLENADSPEVLMSVVDVIVHIAREYPHVFGTHFRVSETPCVFCRSKHQLLLSCAVQSIT